MTADEEDKIFDILKEKIRSLQEKYREHEELFCQTKLNEESPEKECEVDRFQDIFKGLLPCKLELSNIEEDLRNLKRRYKTPQEYLESEKGGKGEKGEKEQSRSHSPVREKVRARRDSYRANEEDVKHMVMGSVGRNYRVNVPLSVLSWDSLDDDFLINNDLVLCKVGDGVMTRLSVSYSEDNEVSVAGENMMARLGVTVGDLQPCIDVINHRQNTLAAVGERVVEMVRNKRRILTRIVFVSSKTVVGLHLSWFSAAQLGLLSR